MNKDKTKRRPCRECLLKLHIEIKRMKGKFPSVIFYCPHHRIGGKAWVSGHKIELHPL